MQQTAVKIEMELKPEVTVRGRYLTMADVATVNTNHAQIKEMVDALRLGRSPQIGYVEQFTREALERTLKMQLLNFSWTVDWVGARAVKIRLAAHLYETANLVEVAKAHLLQELGTRFEAVDVQPVLPIADVMLPSGDVTLRSRKIDIRQFSTRVPVWIDIEVNGVMYRSVVVPFSVHISQTVYVAKRDLPEGILVSSDDFEVRTQEVSDMINQVVAIPNMQGTRRIRRQIRRGQILTSKHVAQPGVVLRGDFVKLVFAAGGVLLETRAIAQQDAQLGQLVKVKPEKSSEPILGRVISDGVIQAEGR